MKKLLSLLVITINCFGQGSYFAPLHNDTHWNFNSLLVKAKPAWNTDASSNNFQATVSGNTRLSLKTPIVNSSSALFDGTNDNITFPDNDVYNLVGDYTIECWVRPTVIPGIGFSTIASKGWGTAWGTFAFIINNAGILQFYSSSTGSSWDIVSGLSCGTPTVNVYSHVAVSRQSGVFKAWLNGVQISTVTNNTNAINTASALFIGTDIDSNSDFTGNISNFRISNIARYISNFTPSTIPFVSDANTILLTLQNPISVDNSEFLDGSPNDFAITRNGNVSNGNFGPSAGVGSGYFDGTDDYLTTTGIAIPTNFCFETYVNIPNTTGVKFLFDSRLSGSSPTSIAFYFSNGNLSLWSNGIIINVASGIVANTWTHIALNRNGSTLQLFVNGTQINTTTFTANLTDNVYKIGAQFDNANVYTGFYSLYRLSSVSRYTSNFTPSTSYTSDANTVLFLPFSNAGIIDGANKNNIETTNTTISTAIPKFGKSVMSFNGTTSRMIVPSSTALELGNSEFTIDGWIYPTNVTGGRVVIGKHIVTGGASWMIYQSNNALNFYASGDGVTWNIVNALSIGTIAANTSYYFMVRRIGNVFTAFLNGVQGGTTTNSGTIFANTSSVIIGSDGNNTVASYYSGTIFDIRIKKRVGLANYVLTAPLTY